jgi:hypothetical protein
MDAQEKRRKRDRERYERMTNEQRQEELKNAKEQKRKRDQERYKERNERMTDEERQDKLKKRREVYHQKKDSGKTPEQKAAQCAQERQKYANMQPEQKKARIKQIEARHQLRRNTPSKDSLAMENPEYVATEEEVSTSTFTVKHRDHVAAGERQTLLHRRNEEFTRRRKQTVPVSSKEDASMTETCDKNNQTLEQPQVMTYGNNLDFILAFQVNVNPSVQLTIYSGQTSPPQCFQASEKPMHQHNH